MVNLLMSIVHTVPDIPRYHTAIAEWLFTFVIILYLPKRIKGNSNLLLHAFWFILILGFQLLAGTMPIQFWIINMIIAVLIMFAYILTVNRVSLNTAGYFVIIAFTMAELAASLEWQISYFLQVNIEGSTDIISLLTLMVVYAVLFSVVIVLEKRYKARNFQIDVTKNDLWSVLLIGITIFSISNISFVNIQTPFSGQYPSEILYIRTLVDLAGVILLYSQREHKMAVFSSREAYTMQHLLNKQYEQFQQSIKNAEIVNQRYHDLKHYINLLRSETDINQKEAYLNELEQSIKPHEAQYKTGHSELDILLTQKAEEILEHQINFTCVADGVHLKFINVLDLLSIFGNAIDNAIESVRSIEQIDKRIIKLAIFKQNQLLFIKFDNYFNNELNVINGNYLTTKRDKTYHGFGLKSIKNIVDKYGGNVKISTENHWFTLMILIPIIEDESNNV